MSFGPDFWFLAAGAVLAGVVRGFAGFGMAMIYLSFAGRVLDPFTALVTLVVLELTGPVPLLPRALREGQLPDVRRLFLGMALTMPVGVYVLTLIDPTAFRYGVSLLTFTLLILLVAGVRYRGAPTPRLVYGTGAAGGFLGGMVGIPGPPVILLYMASTLPSSVIRANNILFLYSASFLLLLLIWFNGQLNWSGFVTGLTLVPIFVLANMAGGAIYRPGNERIYRAVAYVIVGASALSGLPIWDG